MSTTGFNVVSVGILLLGALAVGVEASAEWPAPVIGITAAVFLTAAFSPQVARQWEKAIVLRLGRFSGSRGPGLFFVVPFLERVVIVVDQRVITTTFTAEQTLTGDTVPVNVDAVLFWQVHDAEKAALDVQDYRGAVGWAAQTALRDLIGRTSLADMLTGREKMERSLQEMILQRIGQWGVTSQAVEMRDVVIPETFRRR